MPRLPLDYSNTCFYKIVCRDLSIPDVYVGHTTNFSKRKTRHKGSCNNPKYHEHNQYVYRFIRENGGWDNFDMILIDRHSCTDKLDAERKERQYIETLSATLNKVIPARTEEEKVEYKHQWSMTNKDKVDAKHRETYKENREEVLVKVKAYYEQNKEKCHEWKNATVNCECGFSYTNANKARHEKSQRHQLYLQRIEID